MVKVFVSGDKYRAFTESVYIVDDLTLDPEARKRPLVHLDIDRSHALEIRWRPRGWCCPWLAGGLPSLNARLSAKESARGSAYTILRFGIIFFFWRGEHRTKRLGAKDKNGGGPRPR